MIYQVMHGGEMQELGFLACVSRCAQASSDALDKMRADPHADMGAAFGSSSEGLKDAPIVSYTSWLSEKLSPHGDQEISVSSMNKSLAERNREAVFGRMVDSIAQQIAANGAVSYQAQANVTQNVALYLLSVGVLTEAVPEPEQKQLTLFETDEMGMRIKTRVPPRPF